MRSYKRENGLHRVGYRCDGRAEKPAGTERKRREEQQQEATASPELLAEGEGAPGPQGQGPLGEAASPSNVH